LSINTRPRVPEGPTGQFLPLPRSRNQKSDIRMAGSVMPGTSDI